ncbi:hypothetical protein SG34_019910 [Thalassomonas viridans]|uniref:Uncharacterized protein n=1 Tax=Thalassomonas viridans TaxID=137584 RepID=A0AAE9Z1R4_9GAMM|nr:hypothetical protein [Thalassomonas viridans]WDE03632.1 hypothetical protein SG34_019910 [Thalassomonas viridans]
MPMIEQNDRPGEKERRHLSPSKHELWSQLNVSQQASVSSLYTYGYELAFIRVSSQGKIAVMILNGSPIVIDDEGTINPHPEIQIRQ